MVAAMHEAAYPLVAYIQLPLQFFHGIQGCLLGPN
jgi:hypothetical protein